MEKIGIFLCNCSNNISNIIDFNRLKDSLKNFSNIEFIKEHNLLCSEEGRKFFKDTVQQSGISRILFCGCSPKQYEDTFRKLTEEAGLNPYLLHIVNIREQCAYVTENREEATEKAIKLLKAGFKRLLFQKPLKKNEVIINPDVVVIGAGVSGVEAALLLASKNRKVYLIEKKPIIGGFITKQEELFPNMECATCLMEPELDKILHNENIKLFTLTEIKEIKGFAGNFELIITKNPRFVDETKCFGCGLCFDACPVSVPNEYNFGLNQRKAIFIPYQGALPFVATIDKENCIRFKGENCNKCQQVCSFDAIDFNQKSEEIKLNAGAIVVATGHSSIDKKVFLKNKIKGKIYSNRIFTSFEFERIISQTGPTSGEIKLDDGTIPKSFAIVHCAGSRSNQFYEYCSAVCCKVALKYNKIIKDKIKDSRVYHFYKDLVLPDKQDMKFYNNNIDDKELFIRVQDIDNIKFINKGKKIKIKTDKKNVTVDMVILMTPIVSNPDNKKLAELLDISIDEYNFFRAEHNLIAPVSSEIRGIYIAGTSVRPSDVSHSVLQAGKAAANILSELIPGEKMELDAIVAEIDDKKCSGCKTCIVLCPYKAISYDKEKKVSVIQSVLCKGCGSCVAACPAGAITAHNFEDSQILTELMEVI